MALDPDKAPEPDADIALSPDIAPEPGAALAPEAAPDPEAECDIEADPELHRRYLERIPVVELGTRRVELVVTVGKMRHLLAETLDAATLDAATAAGDPPG